MRQVCGMACKAGEERFCFAILKHNTKKHLREFEKAGQKGFSM